MQSAPGFEGYRCRKKKHATQGYLTDWWCAVTADTEVLAGVILRSLWPNKHTNKYMFLHF